MTRSKPAGKRAVRASARPGHRRGHPPGRRVYRNAGIRWDNELLSAIAAEFPSIAAVRDALREIESEGEAR